MKSIKVFYYRYIHEIKHLLFWLWQGKYLFLIPITFILTYFLGSIFKESDLIDYIYAYGTIMQVLGTLLLIKIFRQKIFLFGNPGLYQVFKSYLLARPFQTKKHKLSLQFDDGISLTSKLNGLLEESNRPNEVFSLKDLLDYVNQEFKSIRQSMDREQM